MPGPSGDKLPTGAYCLGLSAPPPEQIQAVLARREVRGRRHIPPDQTPIMLKPTPGGLAAAWPKAKRRLEILDRQQAAALAIAEAQEPIPPEVSPVDDGLQWHTLERTVLPANWFDGSSEWELVFARRWRAILHINAGELRAATLWFRVFAGTVGPARWRVLDLTDSMVANGILARGRASSYQLNKEARRRAGCHAASPLC